MTATEQRDVRSGAAVWEAYPSEDDWTRGMLRSCKIDVVIVGAGVTGALVAEATTAAGLSTIVIDRRAPSKGSTAASTALLQFEIDTPLIHLADQIGFTDAAQAWKRSYGAVQGLTGLINRLAIACGFRSQRAIYLCGNVLGPDELAREARARSTIGMPSRFLDHSALQLMTGIQQEAAILSAGAADLNPVQLTHGILSIAAQRGASICTPVELAEVVPLRATVGLVTADGIEIEAKSMIFATGYELAHGVPAKGHRISSTWAFATAPQPRSLRAAGKSVIWEASDPYLYIRSTIDGRLIVGGEDEDMDDERMRDALLVQKVEALQEKTRRVLPWLNIEADYSWAGTFGESETGLPTIGPVPGMPHCYAVLGYGGNGITFGYLAAQLLNGYLSARPDPDAALFAFK